VEIKEIIKKEGDYKEFEYLGYKCVIIRHPDFGYLCGYVGVERSHGLYGIDYTEIPDELGIDLVHGGLTYSGRAHWNETDDRWYFGFDCGHHEDFCPFLEDSEGVYRTMDYVEGECKRLADALYSFQEFYLKVVGCLSLLLRSGRW